jgi:hypothetical protein
MICPVNVTFSRLFVVLKKLACVVYCPFAQITSSRGREQHIELTPPTVVLRRNTI